MFATAIGRSPTAVSTEYLPPTFFGILNISYSFLIAKSCKIPFSGSVVTYILDAAITLPYFCSNTTFRVLKVTAGSSVEPDLDITLIAKSLSSKYSTKFLKYLPLKLLPAKIICGCFLSE